jgi:hypothetical protein
LVLIFRKIGQEKSSKFTLYIDLEFRRLKQTQEENTTKRGLCASVVQKGFPIRKNQHLKVTSLYLFRLFTFTFSHLEAYADTDKKAVLHSLTLQRQFR